MYLLDTGIVAELRRGKAAGTGLATWAASIDRAQLFVSAVTLLELQSAVVRLMRTDKHSGAALRAWIDTQLVPAFTGRILAVDVAVARRRATLALADDRDALVAATALEHGLTLVTGQAAAFKASRVKLLDPLNYEPDAFEDDADWQEAGRTGPLWLRNLFVRT